MRVEKQLLVQIFYSYYKNETTPDIAWGGLGSRGWIAQRLGIKPNMTDKEKKKERERDVLREVGKEGEEEEGRKRKKSMK